ncbi:MAG: LON peptidase substrate-binding domain-containing protein [Phycisphaerales bacterium]|nr:LON peptidase substrate-binding domain-containing protein [Phycisphaerales bacterium]
MSTSVRVNFNLPVPLFPLPEAILLPQSVAPIHIFEPRYCQMIEDTLDRAGQIGLACFADNSWRDQYEDTPALRPVVCLGQIVQHERVSDGYQVVLHGICRARIISMVEPAGDVLYRAANLRPLLGDEPEEAEMELLRSELESLLCDTDLRKMESVTMVLKCMENQQVDTPTLLEIVAAALVHDSSLRYEILAEASVSGRADLVRDELLRLEHLLLLAFRQHRADGDYHVSIN